MEWPSLGTSSNGMPLICSLLGASRRRASNYSFWAKGKQVNAEKMVCCLVGPKSMSWLKSFHGGHVRGFFSSDLFNLSFSFIILKWGKPIENDRKSIEHQRKWMENERKWMENDNDNKWNLSIPIVLYQNTGLTIYFINTGCFVERESGRQRKTFLIRTWRYQM